MLSSTANYLTTKQQPDTPAINKPVAAKWLPLWYQPAFYDMETGTIYLSRFKNGNAAPVHVYETLPATVSARLEINIISGFISGHGQFITSQITA